MICGQRSSTAQSFTQNPMFLRCYSRHQTPELIEKKQIDDKRRRDVPGDAQNGLGRPPWDHTLLARQTSSLQTLFKPRCFVPSAQLKLSFFALVPELLLFNYCAGRNVKRQSVATLYADGRYLYFRRIFYVCCPNPTRQPPPLLPAAMTTPLARARSHHYSPPKTSFLEARGRTLQLSIRPISQSQSSQSTEHTEPLEEFSDDEFDCCSEDERELLKLDIDQIVARHPILIQQTTSFTSNWSSSQINSQPRNLPPGFVPELAPAPTKDRVKGYLAKWLIDQGPFSISTCSTREGMTFHLNHEVARVALQTGIPISELMMVVHDNRGFKFIWDCLTEAVNVREKSMPEPSQQDLFLTESFDWDCVTPSGKLTMAWDTNKKRNDRPFFEFQVRPLSRRQKSNRFTRKFGSDRFFELDVPLPSKESLPSELNKGKADLEATREFVMEWLYGQSHFFLERQWRALFPKPSERRTRKPGEARANGLKVYLFAEKGLGIEHQDEMPVFKVMDWFLSVNLNLHQPSLKLFARLRMGKSFDRLLDTGLYHMLMGYD